MNDSDECYAAISVTRKDRQRDTCPNFIAEARCCRPIRQRAIGKRNDRYFRRGWCFDRECIFGNRVWTPETRLCSFLRGLKYAGVVVY